MPISTKQRKTFFTSKFDLSLPDLVEIQKASYDWFLKKGIKELFEEFSPIEDAVGRNHELHFKSCSLGAPKFDEITSKNRNLTYEAPLTVKARLINKKTGKKTSQEVYFSDIPLMTKRGTFIINGIERVVVQQLVRSPGVFFSGELIKGRLFYGAKIIPDRGAWFELETDTKGVMWVRIDRQRKTTITALLRVFELGTDKEILDAFKQFKDGSGLDYIKATLEKDPSSTEQEGLIEVYRKIRPGELATVDNAKSLIYAMLFKSNRYDLSKVGRYKMNQRLGFDKSVKERVLRQKDIVAVIAEMIRLSINQSLPDDIDHLANRRVRAVGESVQNRMRVGMLRLQRIIRDRMSVVEQKALTPGQLINVRPITGVIREFFMSSQLSQFMDQTNILSELEHKRRLTAVGPGGLTRERAGFEVRDVHRTYYGKICPIATPEGPNVGLVNHLSCYARLSEYGFMETPYRKVVKGKLTNEIAYLNAHEEEQHILAPYSTPIDKNGNISEEGVEARIHGRPGFCRSKEVEFIDVASNQVVSVATSLIPFLEHDDGVRALMGTNMQRQAVPLVRPASPLVGTGIEARIAKDSDHMIHAQKAGRVTSIDANHVTISYTSGGEEIYYLNKFQRSNFDTCFNQRPTVAKGQRIKAGEILAEGPSIENGELALGQNILVAFMPWEGGNYEDAILISSRLVQSDLYSSLHIDEHTIDIRETKFGPEMMTCDIPNVSEEKLKNLDDEGIVRIGAEVQSGDILVGKITPKGEIELTAEEKLLRAIFGEKAQDVRDSSLYLEHGEHGKIIDIKIFSRDKGDKLPSGVIKSISVLIADLRKIQIGDKMAGRHGNKGVISRIVAEEDMPYLKDGTPVDIILNPLGVVSRMNLGQILETHLGLAAQALGYKAASPVLNGVTMIEIKRELKRAGYSESGKAMLYDGRTSEQFKEPITIGYIYMMKLNHLVEDKIHQRSIGPYSLITQQPLGGKAQFGGQRFGEMEVWALEGYGAAHALQEMLTIKSDDVVGRTKAYESIIKDEPIKEIHIPESFSVLVRELKGLALGVDMLRHGRKLPARRDKKSRR
ncbi:DNA-directed RNA polymerase subunit beta [Patescibacteria group bacterium AH-259-L05]|nr:DNA-directed RNA polymerase subunit beta [Patescibacteria group bacterium AH-259-L05]